MDQNFDHATALYCGLLGSVFPDTILFLVCYLSLGIWVFIELYRMAVINQGEQRQDKQEIDSIPFAK